MGDADKFRHNRSGTLLSGSPESQDDGILGDADDARLERRRDEYGERAGECAAGQAGVGVLVYSASQRPEVPLQQSGDGTKEAGIWEADGNRSGGSSCFWSDLEWLQCSDGKARPAKPGIFPLVAGLPKGLVRGGDRSMAPDADQSAEGRVMRLRGYGNAICPQVASAFIEACT